jgi:hypothetical protein
MHTCVLCSHVLSQISAEGIVAMFFVVSTLRRALYLVMGHACRQHCDAIEQYSPHESLLMSKKSTEPSVMLSRLEKTDYSMFH